MLARVVAYSTGDQVVLNCASSYTMCSGCATQCMVITTPVRLALVAQTTHAQVADVGVTQCITYVDSELVARLCVYVQLCMGGLPSFDSTQPADVSTPTQRCAYTSRAGR